jgi:hypothetical protein
MSQYEMAYRPWIKQLEKRLEVYTYSLVLLPLCGNGLQKLLQAARALRYQIIHPWCKKHMFVS